MTVHRYPRHSGILAGSSANTDVADSEWVTINGHVAPTVVQAAVRVAVPCAGILRNLQLVLSAAPNGATKTRTVQIYVDGGASGVTCTCTDTETSARDETHVKHVTAGQLLSVLHTSANAPDASVVYVSVEFVPDSDR